MGDTQKNLDTYLSRRLTMLKRSLSLKWNFLPFYMFSVHMSIDNLHYWEKFEQRNSSWNILLAGGSSFGQRLKNSKMKPENRKFRNLLFSAIEIIFIFVQGKKISIQYCKNTRKQQGMHEILFMLGN